MARRRLFTELGRGVDLRGRDYTKAAVRALSDALQRNSLTVVPALGYPPEAMEVDVLVGVARPDEVDVDAVAAVLPYGTARVRPVRGGLDVEADAGDGCTVVANAAAVVWLDMDGASDDGTNGGAGGDADPMRTPARDLAAEDRAQDAARRASEAERITATAAPARPVAPPGTTWHRVVLETGTGADLRGEDPTKAARRAVHDALHASSIALFDSLGIDPASMVVEIRVGVQDPGRGGPGRRRRGGAARGRDGAGRARRAGRGLCRARYADRRRDGGGDRATRVAGGTVRRRGDGDRAMRWRCLWTTAPPLPST